MTTTAKHQGNNGPSHRLTFQEAVQVWIRYWSGEFQNRIAASFDVNPGRVNEVLKGKRHPGSEQAAIMMK
jgi:predicted XRE-type DNA-binding protein